MTETLVHRQWLQALLLAAIAVAYGAAIAVQPLAAAALAGTAIVVALAFLAPVTHLAILLFLTTIVPYSVSNRYLGASAGPGLLLPDLFLVTGLARAAVTLAHARLDPRRLAVLGLIGVFCLWALFAAYRGVREGGNLSDVGVELRQLSGFSVAFIAMAILLEPRSSEPLMRGLVVLGLLLGLWGLTQWVADLSFGVIGQDFGVREGVSYAPGARGQVQGGLFAFPVAIIVSVGALISGQLRSRLSRLAVSAVLATNAVSLLLTFERTFWVVTVLGVVVVFLRIGRSQRGRAVLWTVALAVVALVVTSEVSPGTLQTASARLLSIGEFGTDPSLRYRRVESEHVLREIAKAPVVGAGLGAGIWWGRPWDDVPPSIFTFVHNGYLWLAWKIGIGGCLLLMLVLCLSIAWRGPPEGGRLLAAVRVGAQASLVALLVAAMLFPVFTASGVTTLIGALIAICALPRSAGGAARHVLE
jgi:hypothetical protein